MIIRDAPNEIDARLKVVGAAFGLPIAAPSVEWRPREIWGVFSLFYG